MTATSGGLCNRTLPPTRPRSGVLLRKRPLRYGLARRTSLVDSNGRPAEDRHSRRSRRPWAGGAKTVPTYGPIAVTDGQTPMPPLTRTGQFRRRRKKPNSCCGSCASHRQAMGLLILASQLLCESAHWTTTPSHRLEHDRACGDPHKVMKTCSSRALKTKLHHRIGNVRKVVSHAQSQTRYKRPFLKLKTWRSVEHGIGLS